jgi:hypothetical protein
VWFSDASGCVFGGALVGWLAGAVWGAVSYEPWFGRDFSIVALSIAGVLAGAAVGLLVWLVLRPGRR